MTWESDSTFVESDVIEWTEEIWPQRRRRRKTKPSPVGKQRIIAQITGIDGDFIKLTVLKSEIVENSVEKEVHPPKPGSVITKKRQTLLRGESQRLHWSEEDVRKALLH